jgi:hypothetical protein
MADPTPASSDRDILLDAIVQRLAARKPTAAIGERIGQAIHMLRKMERATGCWEDADGRVEFLREVANGLAAKITTGLRPSSLNGLRSEWDTLTACVQAIITTGATFDSYLPPRRGDIETALRQLAQEWLTFEARPSLTRHILDNAKDTRGIAFQLLWAARGTRRGDPESMRRALKRVSPEAPW